MSRRQTVEIQDDLCDMKQRWAELPDDENDSDGETLQDFRYRVDREASERLGDLDQLVRDLVDTTNTECHYDHNDYCQVHYRHRPCANARALEYINEQ